MPPGAGASDDSHTGLPMKTEDRGPEPPRRPRETLARRAVMQHDMTQAMRDCVDACNACRVQCLVNVAHGAESGGALAAAQHLQVLLDCAALCTAAVDLLARGSTRHRELCRLCADVCRACEASCRGMPESSTPARCAEVFRACAEACESVAAA
jgi:hypothetical protein